MSTFLYFMVQVKEYAMIGYKKKPVISLANCLKVATRICKENLTLRGRVFSDRMLAKALAAAVVRRLQSTATNKFSTLFDEAVAAVNAQVPAIFNKTFASVPLNGNMRVQGKIYQVDVSKGDFDEIMDYVLSGQFKDDLLALKFFISTNGIVAYPLNVYVPFVLPSSVLVCDREVDFTLSPELRTLQTGIEDPHYRLDPSNPDDKVPIIYVDKYPGESPVTRVDHIAVHTSSSDVTPQTEAQGLSTILPIVIVVEDGLLDALPYVAPSLNLKLSARFDDVLELDIHVDHGITVLFEVFCSEVAKSQSLNFGTVDNRQKGLNPVAGEGQEGPRQHQQRVGEEQGFTSNPSVVPQGQQPQRGALASSTPASDGLSRPAFNNAQGRGSNGGRGRGGRTRASAHNSIHIPSLLVALSRAGYNLIH